VVASRGRTPRGRQAQESAARRRRTRTVTTVVLAVLVLLVGGGVLVQVNRNGDGGGAAVPQGTVNRYAVPRGDASAPVTLTIYEDFLCPACRDVEGYLDRTVDEYVERGTLRVEYRPIAFLDGASTTEYSTRALGAAACVLDDSGPDAFVRMHDLLYANQPPEGGPGLSDAQLATLAGRADADRGAVSECMRQDSFAGWVEDATDHASRQGVNATPTLLVNGEPLQFSNDEDPITTLRQAVENAA
jgi:protein-disulfide isomerase